MIKLKNILVVLTVLFIATFAYADEDIKNFISVNSAGGKATGGSSVSNISVGQTVVATKETKDTIFRAGFLSAVRAPQNDKITFTDLTEQKVFETNVVPVKVKVEVKSEEGADNQITKLVYRIAEGENGKFGSYIPYVPEEKAPDTTITFDKEITFDSSQNQHRIQFYAQYTNKNDENDYSSRESNEFTIWTKIISSGTFKIISPDPIMATAAIDPAIETTALPIDLVSTVTISLVDVGELKTSTSVLVANGMIDKNTCKLKCNYSELVDLIYEGVSSSLPKDLLVNKEYTLRISLSGEISADAEVTFKIVGTGVADIYVYPSPFKPKQQNTTIQFVLAHDSDVTINLYDKAGKIVCQLVKDKSCKAGINKVEWNGKNYAGQTLAVGAYICEIIAKSTAGKGEHRRYTALAIGK